VYLITAKHRSRTAGDNMGCAASSTSARGHPGVSGEESSSASTASPGIGGGMFGVTPLAAGAQPENSVATFAIDEVIHRKELNFSDSVTTASPVRALMC
jgi:hypothetical protein